MATGECPIENSVFNVLLSSALSYALYISVQLSLRASNSSARDTNSSTSSSSSTISNGNISSGGSSSGSYNYEGYATLFFYLQIETITVTWILFAMSLYSAYRVSLSDRLLRKK